jgi:UDP-N-acetylmuramoyl-tripeptide--D-alanyl-D-alanine ligase
VEPTSLKKIAFWAGGKLNAEGGFIIDNAVIDSRKAGPGSLFFCFKGKTYDGHKYCGQVKKQGGYSVGEKEFCDITVESTKKALGRLAKGYIKNKNCKVIAVTGSAGKTTTVRIIENIFKELKETVATPKNFNNHIGLPLTLLEAENSTEYLITEMGANHKGEIKYLAGIAGPSAGVITNIGNAHIGYFKNKEEILETKVQLAEYVNKKGGQIIYNYDDDALRNKCSGFERSVGFGFSKGSDLQAEIITKDKEGTTFKVDKKEFRLNIPGAFNVSNALAALAVSRIEKISDKISAKALREIKLPKHRMEKVTAGRFEIIDDAYNANPESVKIFLKEISELYPGREIIAVIGRMRELGEFAEELHYQTGKFIGGLHNVKNFLATGYFKKVMVKGAVDGGLSKEKIKQFSSIRQAAGIIKKIYGERSLIVLKASRLQKLEKIIEELGKEKGE